jgi:hypothetical protein
MAEITEAEVREFLLVQHIDLVDISVAHAFAQAWLDHEAQVAELQEQNYLAAKENECERQATRDAQAVRRAGRRPPSAACRGAGGVDGRAAGGAQAGRVRMRIAIYLGLALLAML